MFKHFWRSLSKEGGQGVVEVGLIIVIAVVSFVFIAEGEYLMKNFLNESIEKGVSENPTALLTPAKPDKDDIWGRQNFKSHTEDHKFRPVAFFSVPNPTYVGENITIWNGSYDPDGRIVKCKISGSLAYNGCDFTSRTFNFSSTGEYTVNLEVEDDDGLIDTYSTVIKVENRDAYTKLEYDHANESREEISRSGAQNVGSNKKLIIDHQYGYRKDRYSVNHLVIEKNLHKEVQNRQETVNYKVTIPVIETTYYSDGSSQSRPYKVNGTQLYVEQFDSETIPLPADIKTEWKNNTWTFYIYNKVSSVQNPNNSWGSRNPSADYSRFDPEVKKTRQDPEFVSSRTTTKSNSYNTGSNSSTPCPTCTEPNRFETHSQGQTDYRNVSGCNGRTWSKPTHTRTYNWLTHKSYDWVYQYTGSGTSQGNATDGSLVYKHRDSWTTQGWQSGEMVGTGTAQTARPKYTNCSGDGGSENCWKAENNSDTANDSWEWYDDYDWTEDRSYDCNCRKVTEEVCEINIDTGNKECVDVEKTKCDTCKDEKYCTRDYYKRKEWSCDWTGTTLNSSTYSWGYTSSDSCSDWTRVSQTSQ